MGAAWLARLALALLSLRAVQADILPPPDTNDSAPTPAPLGAAPSPAPTCQKDTGGTCQTGPCNAERNAACIDKKCMCADGFCAEGGICKYKAECSMHTKCSDLLGMCCPSSDNESNLECCASEDITPPKVNETQCGRDTGANCHVLGCKDSRNATCVDRQCMCGDGQCTVPDPEYPDGDKLCSFMKQCAFHSGCAGLLGDCCPGPNGMLDCCASRDRMTSGAVRAPAIAGLVPLLLFAWPQ